VRGLWPRNLRKLGKDGPDQAPDVRLIEREVGKNSPDGPRIVRVPEGIDPGFEYAPGASRLKSAMPPERPDPPVPGSAGDRGLPNTRPRDALPPARPFAAADLLARGLPAQDYAQAFLERFGATLAQPVIFKDAIGERLVIGAELFKKPNGAWKADKRERGPFMPLLALALQEPDEIWARLEWHHVRGEATVRRRYVARFEVEGQEAPALVIFEMGDDGWSGTTTFLGVTQSAEDWRVGVRLYRRPDAGRP